MIALVLLAAITVEGDCPRASELHLDAAATIKVTSDRRAVHVEMFDADDRRVAEKTLTTAGCRERAETVEVLIAAWLLELEVETPAPPVVLAHPIDGAIPRLSWKTPPLPVQEYREDSRKNWLVVAAGSALIAGGVSLNVATSTQDSLDQPNDFIPVLLYVTGAALILGGLFGGG